MKVDQLSSASAWRGVFVSAAADQARLAVRRRKATDPVAGKCAFQKGTGTTIKSLALVGHECSRRSTETSSHSPPVIRLDRRPAERSTSNPLTASALSRPVRRQTQSGARASKRCPDRGCVQDRRHPRTAGGRAALARSGRSKPTGRSSRCESASLRHRSASNSGCEGRAPARRISTVSTASPRRSASPTAIDGDARVSGCAGETNQRASPSRLLGAPPGKAQHARTPARHPCPAWSYWPRISTKASRGAAISP